MSEESNQPLEVGATVNMISWDATVPQQQRLGPCRVIACWRDKCESGWLVLLRAESGREVELDSHWVD